MLNMVEGKSEEKWRHKDASWCHFLFRIFNFEQKFLWSFVCCPAYLCLFWTFCLFVTAFSQESVIFSWNLAQCLRAVNWKKWHSCCPLCIKYVLKVFLFFARSQLNDKVKNPFYLLPSKVDGKPLYLCLRSYGC